MRNAEASSQFFKNQRDFQALEVKKSIALLFFEFFLY